jgi:hypothetical protein
VRARARAAPQRERLWQVVVGACREPGDAIAELVARDEHQHGRSVADVAHAPAHLEAVEPGHQDVEEHRVGGRGGLAAHGLAPVAGERDLESVEAQDALERLTDSGLVVDDQDAHVPRWLSANLKDR